MLFWKCFGNSTHLLDIVTIRCALSALIYLLFNCIHWNSTDYLRPTLNTSSSGRLFWHVSFPLWLSQLKVCSFSIPYQSYLFNKYLLGIYYVLGHIAFLMSVSPTNMRLHEVEEPCCLHFLVPLAFSIVIAYRFDVNSDLNSWPLVILK